MYREIHLGDIALISVRQAIWFCLRKLTERQDVHNPPAGNCSFSETLHGGAGQVNKGVSAMGFRCVAVCNLQNYATGLSVRSVIRLTRGSTRKTVVLGENLLSDVIKQVFRGIQNVEQKMRRLSVLDPIEHRDGSIGACNFGNILPMYLPGLIVRGHSSRIFPSDTRC